MIFLISDLHFNSDNIIEYCNRPFKNAEAAKESMIAKWNSVVQDDDDVYVLGDFIMGYPETVPQILPRLKGRIHLVRGNHDTPRKLSIYEQYPDKIVEICDVKYLQWGNLFWVLCHFPLTDESFMDMVVRDNSEVVVVHGHTHDKDPFFTERSHVFNVSADVVDFTPQPIFRLHSMVKKHFLETGVWTAKVKE